METSVVSPNTSLMPLTAHVDERQHLLIGGCDTNDLAARFGTPLWIIDYATIEQSVQSCRAGLAAYSNHSIHYAGKAFLCLAMAKIVKQLGLGLDVVSEGELYTALKAELDPAKLLLHGNNKSEKELLLALEHGVKIVVDGLSELEFLASIAEKSGKVADILVRLTPGVEPDTHHYIQTGGTDSKFGVPIDELDDFISLVLQKKDAIKFRGIHAHIGSQSHDLTPYLEIADILADVVLFLRDCYEVSCEIVDVGGGLGIAYVKEDKPLPMYDWAAGLAKQVTRAFTERGLELPELILEPGRSIIGSAGVTLYRAGRVKSVPSGVRYVALDGGMADNPRPATYNARYTAAIANRMNAESPKTVTTLVGRFCESGDIIIKDAGIPAESGDLIAVFATGAYNYSMASNYNRTGRPTCVLVKEGSAEVILERETNEDLLRQDRVPTWLSD